MIIDAHAHLVAKGYRPNWIEEALAGRIATARSISVEQAREIAISIWDPFGDKLVEEMNAGGVDMTVVLTIDYGLVLPGAENDCPVSIEEQFIQTAEACRKHPNRLIWGAGIDPRRTGAIKLVDKAVKELGAKAIKLYPAAGFYPNDKILYPIYEKAVEFGVPIHFHTAPVALPHLRSKFCHPIHLDDVAVDFRELKIQAVHGGGPWWHDMLAIAKMRPNIFLDVGGWQRELGYTLECYRRIREMIDLLGPHRVIWASDWTGASYLPQASWLKAFQNIPKFVEEAAIRFTEEEKSAFLGGAVSGLLGLSIKGVQ